jgi:hypothetical protein
MPFWSALLFAKAFFGGLVVVVMWLLVLFARWGKPFRFSVPFLKWGPYLYVTDTSEDQRLAAELLAAGSRTY